jgi:hypothetical protein
VNQRLQTSQVFIDTQVFICANFQFSSGRLARLSALNNNNKITLHVTDITLREIEANLEKEIKEIVESIKKFQTKAKLLRGIPSFDVLFNFDKDLVIEYYKKELNSFMIDFMKPRQLSLFPEFPENHYKINIISVNNVSVKGIFDKYFNQHPPFKEGKKKSEFPDAFTIAALEKWCQDNEKRMYIVSDDSDIITACSSSSYLISLATLDELFDLITAEDEYISSIAHQWFTKNKVEIEQKIIYEFEDTELFQIPETEGDIDNITVKSIKLSEEKLVEVQDEVLSFTVIADIKFSADVNYPDPDMTFYDREDGEYYVFETIEEVLERTIEISVEIEIYFSRDEPHNLEVMSVNLETGGEINIYLDEGYPYK